MKNEKYNDTLIGASLKLILLLPITTLLQMLFPFSVNRILTSLILFVLAIIIFQNMNSKLIVKFMITVLVVMTTFIFTQKVMMNLDDAIYWMLYLCCLTLFNNKYIVNRYYDEFFRNISFVKFIIAITEIIIIITLFIPSAYRYSESWGGKYFCSYAYSPHTMTTTIIFIELLIITYFLLVKFKIYYLILFFPLVLAVLKSGARTFLISFILLMVFFILNSTKSKTKAIIILGIVGIGVLYFYMQSATFEKMEFLSAKNTYGTNKVATMSSGRTVFWLNDIQAFFDLPFLNKIFGKGFDYVYGVNERTLGTAIWAHNDFVNNLLSVGVLGSLWYLIVLFMFLFKLVSSKKYSMVVLLQLFVLVTAFFAGFYIYVGLIFSLLLIAIIVLERKGENVVAS